MWEELKTICCISSGVEKDAWLYLHDVLRKINVRNSYFDKVINIILINIIFVTHYEKISNHITHFNFLLSLHNRE